MCSIFVGSPIPQKAGLRGKKYEKRWECKPPQGRITIAKLVALGDPYLISPIARSYGTGAQNSI